ncbi:hypothetical protein PIB30_056138 [Stylosanthes scabra]|uniref:Uncharacterized protein n=1 Tax=Stylosanthes scabra TaxID=79078 RepID=A0ABU6TLH8_9FABA|nr:hypothetical protein [Stylosanthes scabra]
MARLKVGNRVGLLLRQTLLRRGWVASSRSLLRFLVFGLPGESPLFRGKPPLSSTDDGGGGGGSGWDSWDNDDSFGSSNDMRRNQSTRHARGFSDGGAGGGGAPSRSRSTEDIYTRSEYEASAANKDSFFARKMAENELRPEGLSPSQGGKYVGFGSSPTPSQRNINPQNDYLYVVSQGIGKLSLVAASAAQSAANVVQASTKDFTSRIQSIEDSPWLLNAAIICVDNSEWMCDWIILLLDSKPKLALSILFVVPKLRRIAVNKMNDDVQKALHKLVVDPSKRSILGTHIQTNEEVSINLVCALQPKIIAWWLCCCWLAAAAHVPERVDFYFSPKSKNDKRGCGSFWFLRKKGISPIHAAPPKTENKMGSKSRKERRSRRSEDSKSESPSSQSDDSDSYDSSPERGSKRRQRSRHRSSHRSSSSQSRRRSRRGSENSYEDNSDDRGDRGGSMN